MMKTKHDFTLEYLNDEITGLRIQSSEGNKVILDESEVRQMIMFLMTLAFTDDVKD